MDGCQRLGVIKRLSVPVGVRIVVTLVVNVETLFCVHPPVAVQEVGLVEGLLHVEPVSVLCSLDVGVQVLLCFPGGLVEELGVGLESRSLGSVSVGLLHAPIELNVLACFLLDAVGLGSTQRLEVGLSKGG